MRLEKTEKGVSQPSLKFCKFVNNKITCEKNAKEFLTDEIF